MMNVRPDVAIVVAGGGSQSAATSLICFDAWTSVGVPHRDSAFEEAFSHGVRGDVHAVADPGE